MAGLMKCPSDWCIQNSQTLGCYAALIELPCECEPLPPFTPEPTAELH